MTRGGDRHPFVPGDELVHAQAIVQAMLHDGSTGGLLFRAGLSGVQAKHDQTLEQLRAAPDFHFEIRAPLLLHSWLRQQRVLGEIGEPSAAGVVSDACAFADRWGLAAWWGPVSVLQLLLFGLASPERVLDPSAFRGDWIPLEAVRATMPGGRSMVLELEPNATAAAVTDLIAEQSATAGYPLSYRAKRRISASVAPHVLKARTKAESAGWEHEPTGNLEADAAWCARLLLDEKATPS